MKSGHAIQPSVASANPAYTSAKIMNPRTSKGLRPIRSERIPAGSESDAREQVSRMCAQLLANPVTEDFELASVSVA